VRAPAHCDVGRGGGARLGCPWGLVGYPHGTPSGTLLGGSQGPPGVRSRGGSPGARGGGGGVELGERGGGHGGYP